MLGLFQWVSDIFILVAALYVSAMALRGHRKEVLAERETDPDRQEALREDARTLYFAASINRVWVLGLIFVGAAVRIAIEIVRAWQWLETFTTG